MKNINAKVVIEYLEFYEGFSFHLDENLLLEFDKLDGKFSFLHITGTCKEVSPEKYIRSLLDKFLDLLNFYNS